MKKLICLSIILLTLTVTACGSTISTETEPTDANTNQTNSNERAIRPTPTSINQSTESTEPVIPEPYPGLPPTTIPFSEGYPAPQEPSQSIEPYPANTNTITVLFPVGIQCEDESSSKYSSEQNAKAGLTAAGITVHDVSTVELMVCAACGCPTSAHFLAEINQTDLDKALALGWVSA